MNEEQREAIQKRTKLWTSLKEWCDKAEELQSAGEIDITLPIEVFLYGTKEVPKSIEAFWKQTMIAKNNHRLR